MASIGNLATGISPLSMQSGVAPQNTAVQQNSSGGFDSLLGSTLTGVSGLYGSQNAAEAQNKGILAGINTQQQTMGNINSLFDTQVGAGNNAFTQLGKLQGEGGAAPDYSGFENTPGYQFAVQQGTQAINRQAAATGSAYTPNTLINVGNYVTNAANSNYNNYVQQLLSTAGLGAQGNSALSGANLTTGGNISQLQQNSGNAEASGIAGGSSSVGSLLSSLLGGGGANSSGLLGAIGKLIGGGSSGSGSGSGNSSGIYNPGLPTTGSDFMNTDLGGNFLDTGYGSQNGPSSIDTSTTNIGNLNTTDLFGSNFNTPDNNFGGFDYNSNP